MKNILTWFIALLIAFVAGCGGGAGGGSGSIPISGSAPSSLSYTSPMTGTVGIPLVVLSPTVTGVVINYSVNPALPAGLTLNPSTGVISGTPTATAAQTTYIVKAANAAGTTTFGWVLTVDAAAGPVSYMLTLTQNGTNFDLSSFAYTPAGTFPNATPASTLTIPAIAPTNGCGGSLNSSPSSTYDLWYDRTNHLLFIAFITPNPSVTLCSYKVDMASGAINFVQAQTQSGATSPGFIDQFSHAYMFSSGIVYSYNIDGTINAGTPLATIGMSNVPTGYGLVDVDVINHWAWYGTNSGVSKAIYGVCPFAYSAASGYTVGKCSPFGYSIPVPTYRAGVDAGNGLYFTTSQIPNPCSATQTVASVYHYGLTTGIISSVPVVSDVGLCAFGIGTPNASGPNLGRVDFADQIFFTDVVNGSGLTINPITYALTPFAFTSFPASVTDSKTSIAGTSLDEVNHIVFVLTTTAGALSGVDAYPYNNSGIASPVSSTIAPVNATPTTNGPTLFEFIY